MSLRTTVARIPGVRAANRFARRVLAKLRSLGRGKPRDPFADSPETFGARLDLWGLAIANRLSRRPVVDPAGTVVLCTTTHGERIKTVHTALESVGRGTVRPRRHILWLDDPELFANLPATIRRLQKRGLEVMSVEPGYKVHTKYYPYVSSIEKHEILMGSSEDDIVYPPSFLADLLARVAEHPDCIVSYRCRTVMFTDDGLAPYRDWIPTISESPSLRHFGTTVSGQVYPTSFLDFVRGKGDAFRTIAPTNDDIWLHHLSVEAGVRTVQVTRDQQHFPFVPGTQAHGLFWTNVEGGQNDVQVAASYTASDIAALRAEPDD